MALTSGAFLKKKHNKQTKIQTEIENTEES